MLWIMVKRVSRALIILKVSSNSLADEMAIPFFWLLDSGVNLNFYTVCINLEPPAGFFIRSLFKARPARLVQKHLMEQHALGLADACIVPVQESAEYLNFHLVQQMMPG